MSAMASQITSLTIVHSTVYSGADQRKHQSSASLAFVRGNHRGPVNSPHKGPVTRKMFPFDDAIMPHKLVGNTGIAIPTLSAVPEIQPPHRISAGGSLLFMRCVSLTLTGLISAWRRGEASSEILAKPLSDYVTVLYPRQCKSRHLKVCEILEKNTCYCQTNWITCILDWGVHFDVVSDAGHTCCCWSFLLVTFPPPNWRTSLTTKIESAFANKYNSLIQAIISFIFMEICAPKFIFFCVVNRKNIID